MEWVGKHGQSRISHASLIPDEGRDTLRSLDGAEAMLLPPLLVLTDRSDLDEGQKTQFGGFF